MTRVLPKLPSRIEGFPPCAALGYTIDVHSPKVDAVKSFLPQLKADGIKGFWVKSSEGEDPRTRKDLRLAKRTLDGAIALCELAHDNGFDWGLYSYFSIGRDGKRFHWDADNELRHQVKAFWKIANHMFATRKSLPGLRTVGDAEDAKRPLEAAQRSAWILWVLERFSQEIGHAPLVYLNANWVNKFLVDKSHKFGDHNADPGLRRFALWQAHYGSKGAKRTTASLAAGPGTLPVGHTHRVAWQFGSDYLGEFDVNVCDMRRVRIPAPDLAQVLEGVTK